MTEKYHNGYDPQLGDRVVDPGAFTGFVVEIEANEAKVEYSDGTHEWWAVYDLDLASDAKILRVFATKPQSGYDLWKRHRESQE